MRTKYGSRAVEVDGLRFHSKKEAARYRLLKAMEDAGEIEGLLLQPRFPLVVNGVKICSYVADFQYLENGVQITEDTKGYRTREYRLKVKLLKALYGIDVRET